MSTSNGRFRVFFGRFTPWWLAERVKSALTVGFRVLWGMIAPLDAALDVLDQGAQAAWPGVGTPTALPLIGRSRGIIRGQSDTDEEFAHRLRVYLDTSRKYGSQWAIANALHEFLLGRPKVRVVNRAGRMTTIDTDGTVTVEDVAWDWDSVTNPENATHWWDEWVIVYSPPWALTGPTIGTPGCVEFGKGIGHFVPRQDVDAVRMLIAQTQSAHSYVRTVIWTYDATLFNPASSPTMPDGRWGQWSMDDPNLPPGSGSRIRSSRSLDCRYWEIP